MAEMTMAQKRVLKNEKKKVEKELRKEYFESLYYSRENYKNVDSEMYGCVVAGVMDGLAGRGWESAEYGYDY